jgi:hypothetical protein
MDHVVTFNIATAEAAPVSLRNCRREKPLESSISMIHAHGTLSPDTSTIDEPMNATGSIASETYHALYVRTNDPIVPVADSHLCYSDRVSEP